MSEIIDFSRLTDEQEKAVKSLERAFKKCRLAKVVLVLTEGSITAYNGDIVDMDGPLSEKVTDFPYNDNPGVYVATGGYVLDDRLALNADYVQVIE